MTRSVLALVALVSLGSVSAQSRIFVLPGDRPGQKLGSAVAVAGDVDRDGFLDVLAGLPQDGPNGPWSGSVRVYSGQSGALLRSFRGDAAGDRFGQAVAGIGDLNGDGFDEIAVGAPFDDNRGPDSGSVRVFSGKDGRVLRSFDGQAAGDGFGQAVAGVGDVDADGTPDLAVGAWLADGRGKNAGVAVVLSGASGAVLHRWTGERAHDLFGWALAGAGDIDGDGHADVIGSAVQPLFGTGYAKVFSGKTGAVLLDLRGPAGSGQFGIAVAGIGDADADGRPDVAVGMLGGDPIGYDAGSVNVYSGRTGKLLLRLPGDRAFGQMGTAVSGAGDLNADGHADIVAGARTAGRVKVFSGKDATLLFRLSGAAGQELGSAVAAGRDIKGDKVPDLILGAKRASLGGAQAGAVFVFSGRKLALETDRHQISLAAGGTQRFSLDAGGGRAGRTYLLLGSASGTRPGLLIGGLRLPLNLDGYLILTLSRPNTPPLFGSFGKLDASGKARAALSLPPGLPAALFGRTLHHAYVVLDATSMKVSFASNAAPLLFVR